MQRFRLYFTTFLFSVITTFFTTTPTAFAEPSVTGFSQSSGPTTGGEEIILHGNEFIKDETEAIASFQNNFFVSQAGDLFYFNHTLSSFTKLELPNSETPSLKHNTGKFVTSLNNNIFCIDADGPSVATYDVSEQFDSPPLKVIDSGDIVFVLTEAGSLFKYRYSYPAPCSFTTEKIDFTSDIQDIALDYGSLIVNTGNALYEIRNYYNSMTPTLITDQYNNIELIGRHGDAFKASDDKYYAWRFEYYPTASYVIQEITTQFPLLSLTSFIDNSTDGVYDIIAHSDLRSYLLRSGAILGGWPQMLELNLPPNERALSCISDSGNETGYAYACLSDAGSLYLGDSPTSLSLVSHNSRQIISLSCGSVQDCEAENAQLIYLDNAGQLWAANPQTYPYFILPYSTHPTLSTPISLNAFFPLSSMPPPNHRHHLR